MDLNTRDNRLDDGLDSHSERISVDEEVSYPGVVKQPPVDLAERLWQVSDKILDLGNEVRIEELAELSGVPRATIYYYFSGRDDVMSFLLTQKVERASVIVAEAAAGPGAPSERLQKVLRAMLQQMADHPSLCTRLMCWMSASVGAERTVIEAQGSLMAPVRALLAEGQASGELAEIDPLDATTAVMGALAMVAMRHTVNGDFDPIAVGDALIPRLLDGLRSRAPQPHLSSEPRGRERRRKMP
jgi:AcrR family transcriptional regulator